MRTLRSMFLSAILRKMTPLDHTKGFPHSKRGLPSLVALLWAISAAGCGGGGDEPRVGTVTFNGNDPYTTTLESAVLSGKAFVPKGASCTYYSGPWAPPGCNCDIGTLASGQWKNDANGTSGSLDLHVVFAGTCTPIEVWWRAIDIPFQLGVNPITVTIADGTTLGTAHTTVVRN